jgi:hypothetical protein
MSQEIERAGLTDVEMKSVWAEALDLWSPYVRLQYPVFCMKENEERKEALSDSFAMIRLTDLRVVISLRQLRALGLEEYMKEILAHEIGHHVFCPADLTDLARLLARIRRNLPTVEKQAPFIANLYSDLMINDRLFRQHNLPMHKIYLKVNEPTKNQLWNLYMRICEILWSLPRQTLTHIRMKEEMEADALLANRLIRNYKNDWIRGSGSFAAICLTYLLKDPASQDHPAFRIWMDTREAASGEEMPDGISAIDDDEIVGNVHPASIGDEETPLESIHQEGGSTNNYREPFEYLEVIKSMGVKLRDEDIIIQYYKERALPHLIPFPEKQMPNSTEPLPEGLETWDVGDPLEAINWLETIVASPVVVPGLTTIERVYGQTKGSARKKESIDLDLYVDCSGSMPDPAQNVSFLTLAAAIISLSALRNGSAVQATLWSGARQFITTDGFIRDQKKILRTMTGFFGGGTAFPLHILRNTYTKRKPTERKVHILVISDLGIDTIFQHDELGNSGEGLTKMALEKAGGGATFVLNLYEENWKKNPALLRLSELGIEICRISNWEDLISFSKDFAKRKFGENNE